MAAMHVTPNAYEVRCTKYFLLDESYMIQNGYSGQTRTSNKCTYNTTPIGTRSLYYGAVLDVFRLSVLPSRPSPFLDLVQAIPRSVIMRTSNISPAGPSDITQPVMAALCFVPPQTLDAKISPENNRPNPYKGNQKDV
ncbi:hypothetical protein ACRALDRAFT_2020113 [Sodiomyces alcalophilus JCM 7366]|uniref:uncharacterized protein n=1 Tax=Sodiomyces alcalophilus JCM 7366 TaxID=591952 RepID=UPI0039B5BC02